MLEVFKIDKTSDFPYYQQLYQFLKEQIEKQVFKAQESLPSENEMQKLYGVSRITIRRALSDLEQDGYVRRQKGKGTIVLEQRKIRGLDEFQGFTMAARKRGQEPGSIILHCDYEQASIKVAEKLQLQPGDQVLFLKRLRLLDGKVIALHQTYISLKLPVSIRKEDFTSSISLYAYLEGKGICLGNADETIEVRMADAKLRKELFLTESKPIVYKVLVTNTVDQIPVEYSENAYIAETFKYSIHIVNVAQGGDV